MEHRIRRLRRYTKTIELPISFGFGESHKSDDIVPGE